MKKFIWISLIFVLSCGSRKTDIQIDKSKQTTNTQSETKTEQQTNEETTSETTYKISEDIFSFGITPIGDAPAKFLFMFDGKKIEGETSGVLNFGNQKTQSEGKTATKQVIHTTYKTETKYQTITTYKTSHKNKQTERESYPIWIYFIAGILATVLAQLVWKIYKPKIL